MNITNKEGLEKIRRIIDSNPRIEMMSIRLDKAPLSGCPMELQQMDKEGNLWFFTSKKNENFEDIYYHNKIQIIYSDDINNNYMSILGNAKYVTDKGKINELWNSPLFHSWFEDKDDPNLILLNVNMEHAYYWSNKKKKLVSFFKIKESTLTY